MSKLNLRAQLTEQIKNQVNLTPKNPADLVGQGTSIIRLKVADVLAYEGNPRNEENPQFNEIKDSIRERGLDAILTVLKRPGSDTYILAKGGKTRLKALQELALEDPKKFEEQDFKIIKYVSEADLLASHLVENLQRSDMTFWDTARGIVKMRETLTQEKGPLSTAQFQSELKKMGVIVDATLPNDSAFACEFFSSLGIYAQGLTRNDIRKTLRPQHSKLSDMWAKHPGHTLEVFDVHYKDWMSMYEAQFDAYDVVELENFLESECANALNYELSQLQNLLTVAHKSEHKNKSIKQLLNLIQVQEIAFVSTKNAFENDLNQESTVDEPTDAMVVGRSSSSFTEQGKNWNENQDHAEVENSDTDGDEDTNETEELEEDDAESIVLTPGVQRLTERLSQPKDKPGFAGIPGLSVSDGSDLEIQPPIIVAAVNRFIEASKTNLGDYVVIDEDAKYGFYVELPSADNIIPREDFQTREAWCLLAVLSGQIYEPDSFPESEFKTLLTTDEENFTRVAFERMGGLFWDAPWFLNCLVNKKKPLYYPLHKLFTVIRERESFEV